jgi:hypothetical protein
MTDQLPLAPQNGKVVTPSITVPAQGRIHAIKISQKDNFAFCRAGVN